MLRLFTKSTKGETRPVGKKAEPSSTGPATARWRRPDESTNDEKIAITRQQLPPPPLPSSLLDPDLALPCLDLSPDFGLPAGFEGKPSTRCRTPGTDRHSKVYVYQKIP
ncbi:uncharacterized protein PGTG_20040 [Puccinia graminis f. sp. tritici CRL 75-36-700-3]|uniref:Uncharacterized protein n=1 Tax=Puccinia graminis f. sp. tritici (strain CRL 75-36-700-3 / race SCCL) TaxID=418459 RepID=E3LBX9_PUCGT|nr:uncharacterized protein PGTG_20040 [Puccinia graminis f. sp. tritici CRL 75-36-700-3]EFP94054.1 hypothetical protein PGTG_20040 [Puccinia graminis f. sp. tritici CRL 75-36-700-3]